MPAPLVPSQRFNRVTAALAAIAADPTHPYCVTAIRVVALLLGKVEREHGEDDVLRSPELEGLLRALVGQLKAPATVESLRAWLAEVIDVMKPVRVPPTPTPPDRPN